MTYRTQLEKGLEMDSLLRRLQEVRYEVLSELGTFFRGEQAQCSDKFKPYFKDYSNVFSTTALRNILREIKLDYRSRNVGTGLFNLNVIVNYQSSGLALH